MNTAIKRISDIDHIKTIYSEHMRKDFPVNELMPFPAIQKMLDSHMYECYGLYCDDKFAGYAFFLRQEIAGCSNYLLDYFAMILDCRDQGYGSLFLGQLKEMLSDADCTWSKQMIRIKQKTMRQERSVCEGSTFTDGTGT